MKFLEPEVVNRRGYDPVTGTLGPDPDLPDRFTVTCSNADRNGKCRITFYLDGAEVQLRAQSHYRANGAIQKTNPES